MTMPEARMAELLHLLQTTDALYPTGAYAHSHGLESLVEAGVVTDAEGLEQYLAGSVVPQLAHAELPWVWLAHGAAARSDIAMIEQLDAECRAQRASRELREASARLGRQRIQMAAELSAHPLLVELAQRVEVGAWTGQAPVACGAVAACAGAGAAASATAFAYQAVSGQLAASVKLIRMGQQGAQRILTRLLPRLAGAAEEAGRIAREDIGWFTPLLDIASARHETAYTRLFIS